MLAKMNNNGSSIQPSQNDKAIEQMSEELKKCQFMLG